MNDPERSVPFSSSTTNGHTPYGQKTGGLQDAWSENEFTTDDEQPTVDRGTAFVSLAFITAALKRSAWLCCGVALFGLIIGYAMYVKFPPAYSATTSVLVANNPNTDSTDQSSTDLALAQSQAVAQSAIRQLGLDQSVSSFLASYSVAAPSVQVVLFTVNGPSSSSAVQRASALAAAFLQFRTSYLTGQEQLRVTVSQQQVTAAQQKIDSLNRQIATLTADPATSAQQSELRIAQAQLTTAQASLGAAQQNESALAESSASTAATMVRGSQVLNVATASPRSFKESKLFYLVIALIAGLAIGAAIVVVRALVSDRLRNRDDIADAIGAPITFSTSQAGTRWLPPLGRGAGMPTREVKRLETHLNATVVPPSAQHSACLAVVAVDNAQDVAQAVVSLAVSWANQGKKVVLADLSDGARAARKLGAKNPGVHPISVGSAQLTVTVPESNEAPPIGPIPNTSLRRLGQVNPQLATAYATADLLLTLITLDPVWGGDHLTTWATEVVAVVTAGGSSSTRIRAVGEMIRLAGARLVSVVLLKADKSDESLGARNKLDQPAEWLPL